MVTVVLRTGPATDEQREAIERVALKRLARGATREGVRGELFRRYRQWMARCVAEEVDGETLSDAARVMVRQFFQAVDLGTYDEVVVDLTFGQVRKLWEARDGE